jgi:6-phosphogluconolactonase
VLDVQRREQSPLAAKRFACGRDNTIVDVELVVVDDRAAAAQMAAELLVQAARNGQHVAFAGGSTPRDAYKIAADLEKDWSGAHVWFGDERCVPPDDERSNYRLANDSLLTRIDQQPTVHRIRGEADPNEAADEYDRELDGVELDLVLLGIGPDGHTASLFPNAPSLQVDDRRAVSAEPGLDPRVERVTMTRPQLATGRQVVFLAVGEDKAEAAERAFKLPPSPDTPSSLVRSARGRTTAILDGAAAARL